MDATEILNLLKYGEHINLECKKAETTLPKSVWETYSSFANGRLQVQIEQDLSSNYISGIHLIKKSVEQFIRSVVA